MRFLLLLIVVCHLAAADLLPVTASENGQSAMPKVIATLLEWSAGGESGGSPKAGIENYLKGGEYGPAIIGYEKARVICDTLRFWQDDRIKGVKRLVPNRLLVEPGPFGQLKDRVIIDTRACRLPQIGFRGLIKPARVTVDRLDQDPAMPQAVRFKAVFIQPGDFFGDLRTDKGWEHYAGWAHEIEMILRGDIDPQQQELTNLRLETIHLFGRKFDGETPREPALLIRTRAAFTEGRTAKSLDRATETDAGVQGMVITLFLDGKGTMEDGRWEAKGDVQMWGDENVFGSKKATPAATPVVLPADQKPQP